MEYIIIFLTLVVLLLLKGFFSGSEIALVSADKIKLRHRAKQGDRSAKLALELFEKPEVLLSTTLVGTNISTIILTTIGTLVVIDLFGASGEAYAIFIFTPLLLIFGEIVPKSIYQQKSDVILPLIIRPLRWASMVFSPVIYVFSRIARLAARVAGSKSGDRTLFITRDQLSALVEMAEHSAAIGAFDRGRIRRVIRFAETTVAEAMIPIAEVASLGRHQATREAINLVYKRGFNRLPIYDNSTNNIVGVLTLSTWDLMNKDLPKKPLEDLIKKPLYVSPLQTIDQLMPVLQRRMDHMAIVVDEFGSAVGMITLEDIVEEVVGEIDVGYDFEEYHPRRKRAIKSLGDGVYIMDSRLSVSEAREVLNINLPTAEFHTLGGLILGRLRRIPREGEFIVEEGFRFIVDEASERNIDKIRVEPDHIK